jgi:ABC-type lipoprotein export system ATPase subunit
LVTTPTYLNCNLLPETVKSQYTKSYQLLADGLTDIDVNADFNESDVNNFRKSIKIQVIQAINLLSQPTANANLQTTTEWCKQWDQEYGFNAKELYPELAEALGNHGY